MCIPHYLIPDEIKTQYNLNDIVENGNVYVDICKGMYGLPQAGKIANDQLVKHLKQYGYSPTKHTPGLWKHKTRDITICLVVDNFGIKYTNEKDGKHLIDVVQTLYTITVDCKGKIFCSITLKWDCKNRTVDLSIPGYIKAVLTKYKHVPLCRPEHVLHVYEVPRYTRGLQMAPLPDETSGLPKDEKTQIQQ
eukprot:13576607-Ditylum_brightwellii.AAC.1